MKTRAWDGKRFRDDHFIDANGYVYQSWCLNSGHFTLSRVDWKLSRFTEHLDIEKNEIYENHIVKLASGSVGVVKFYNGSFVVDIRKRSGTFEFYEWPSEYFVKYDYDDGFVPVALVLGSIFENPELLEEVNK